MKVSAPKNTPEDWGTERQAQVAEIVRAKGHAKVEELARLFGVSAQTIRKDVNAMCERGLLRRVHGGVELSATSADHYALRRILNIGPKRAIGQATAQLIPDETALAVSIGTTPEMVVAQLGQHAGLRIFSNNMHVAMTAHEFATASVTIPGGTLRPSEADIVGPSAVNFFDAYRFDIGVFGVAAVDDDGGLLDLCEEDVRSRDAISRNADLRILVLDVSKFQRRAHARGGHICDVDHVVCDQRPPEPMCQMLAEANVALTICEEAPV